MRAFLADTLALVTFFTLTGILNERFVAGMSWDEIAVSRGIGAPLMVLTARPYGLWRDWAMSRLGWPAGTRLVIWDSIVLLVFQVPIYAAIIWFGGAEGAGLWRGIAGAAILMLCLGRPYGLWLDFVRNRFGLPPGGLRPMSPNGPGPL